MNGAALAATSPRRAALLVHAMPAADRDWLLGTLASHHRVQLELLLEELRALEIPPDAALLREIVEAAPAGPADAQARLARLAPREVAKLVHLLRDEPPQLVATLLAAQPWPWKGAVLAALGERATQARPQQAAALHQALCESVLRRLQDCPSAARAPARLWRRLPIRLQRTCA